MQTRSWIFVTACTLLLTAFVALQAGWLKKDPDRTTRRSANHVIAASSQDFMATEAGARYRAGQTRHWKYLMLKR